MDKIFAVVSITLVGCVLIRFQGKVTATNEELAIVFEEHVSYDLDLPEFGYVLIILRSKSAEEIIKFI